MGAITSAPNRAIAMSFYHMMLTPDRVLLVQQVYRSLLAEPWFAHSAVTEDACAKLVIRIYQLGISSDRAFTDECREQARKRFSTASIDVSGGLPMLGDMPAAWPPRGKETKVNLSH